MSKMWIFPPVFFELKMVILPMFLLVKQAISLISSPWRIHYPLNSEINKKNVITTADLLIEPWKITFHCSRVHFTLRTCRSGPIKLLHITSAAHAACSVELRWIGKLWRLSSLGMEKKQLLEVICCDVRRIFSNLFYYFIHKILLVNDCFLCR